jgi:hypothetical protein
MGYAWAARLARKSITENGTKCVLRVPPGDEEYDAETGAYEGVAAEYPGVCVVTSYKAAAIDGTLIRGTDKSLLCVLPVDPPPSVGLIDVYDRTGVVTDTYTVVHVEKICPDNTTVIAYKIQGRK